MQDHELTAIAGLSAQLAADNRRVIAFIESLMGRVDKLVDAASTGDWQEVQRVSDDVARSSAAYGYPLISESAQMLSQAVAANDKMLMKRRLLKLIAACGSAERSASDAKPLKS